MALFLSLFHGRNTPDEEMNEWGFPGPVIGPVHVAFTYGQIKLFDADPAQPDSWDEFKRLSKTDDCFEVDGKYYGDMEIWDESDPLLQEARNIKRPFITWEELKEGTITVPAERLTDEA